MSAAIIALVLSGIEQAVKLALEVRKAGQQTGEWTAEHEQQFEDRLAALRASPAWQPETAAPPADADGAGNARQL